MLNTDEQVKIALKLVLEGAQQAESHLGAKAISHKGNPRDIVTAADLAVDRLIRAGLEETGLPILSEEQENRQALHSENAFWVVDPIDGTANFANQIPNFTVSIGLATPDRFVLGFVCAPALDELYFTLHPDKALFNGLAFTPPQAAPHDALIAASFGPKASDNEYLLFKTLNETTRGCLRTGSASLNICWAATGKLQAAYGLRAKLWDVAGALAIARAAGARVECQRSSDGLLIDYCVGSPETVQHMIEQARLRGLWSH